MTEQEKMKPDGKLNDDQLDQVAGGTGVNEAHCSCSPIQYRSESKQKCEKCGKPLRNRFFAGFIYKPNIP